MNPGNQSHGTASSSCSSLNPAPPPPSPNEQIISAFILAAIFGLIFWAIGLAEIAMAAVLAPLVFLAVSACEISAILWERRRTAGGDQREDTLRVRLNTRMSASIAKACLIGTILWVLGIFPVIGAAIMSVLFATAYIIADIRLVRRHRRNMRLEAEGGKQAIKSSARSSPAGRSKKAKGAKHWRTPKISDTKITRNSRTPLIRSHKPATSSWTTSGY